MSPPKRRVNWFVLGAGLALVVPLVALFAASFGNNPREVPFVLLDEPAPQFQLVDLDGERWTLADLAGEPVVLNFWSTWCGPCKEEHPILQEAARRYPDVHFLGVIYSDEPDKCRRYLDQVGTTYDHLVDPGGRIAIDYGVAGVPETYFIDRSGTIRYKHAGAVSAPLLIDKLAQIRGTP